MNYVEYNYVGFMFNSTHQFVRRLDSGVQSIALIDHGSFVYSALIDNS